ncbi:MAG: hypothetical protein COV91_02570 [Candidatus Taylorbacteria bacterium CG11_big_fil_rev_8_21_14_0_20_46_11]|uniref:Addiction module toxin, HicA family n=1 Tax=Candidatus Taylorbacteria bacterium CG11_big_fil_rev_8_21_14_0_20_46_11 TaxID=1975025 RepID=A0A2H0KBX9_9BACT|nr:MAG: hypothetical protein COV91_02570 [Candidatus Taylorbacteria bacterium CG11_big_fil_rev_8_21_14_0_20_46_11]
MPRLPQISGKASIAKFLRLGYSITRQKGSHVRLVANLPGKRHLSVPLHKVLKKGLIAQLIQDAGITVQEFIDL